MSFIIDPATPDGDQDAAQPATETDASRKVRILLVDDHPITRQGMRAMISLQHNLQVCGEADNASDALRMLGEFQPDVAVVDITLPQANGIELTREMKSRAPQLAVLVVSMHEETSYAERALRAGAQGYLMKQEAGERFGTAVQQVARGDIFLSPRMRERLARRVTPKRKANDFPFDTLSDRERQVFELVGDGFSTKQIAEKLRLSSKTIDSYREHLKLKLGLESGAELVRHAIAWGRSRDPL
jgi:DNA-binding NarL/FixJ family response regulator